MNDAARAVATDTVRLVLLEPVALVAVRVTVFEPAVAKAWLGFWAVDVDPSPKLHDHDVGVPVDVSVNCTDWPAAGDVGLYVNEAARATTTVTVLLVLLEPEVFVAVRVTVFEPAVA